MMILKYKASHKEVQKGFLILMKGEAKEKRQLQHARKPTPADGKM